MLTVEVMDTELFFDLLTAVLAVFGLWCLMRLAVEGLPYPGRICLAIRVTDRRAQEHLEDMLGQARQMLSWRRRAGIDVLYSRALCENGGIPPDVLAAANRFGARCYLVDDQTDNNQEAGKENGDGHDAHTRNRTAQRLDRAGDLCQREQRLRRL